MRAHATLGIHASDLNEVSVMDEDSSPHDDWLSETLLQAAETAGIGIVVTTPNPLRNVSATPAVGRLFRCTIDEVLRQRDLLANYNDAEKARLARITTAFTSEEALPRALETIVRRADGSRAFVQMGFAPVAAAGSSAIITFLADVTEQHLALESVEKSEARFRSVVESIPEAIWITEDDRITYANPALISLLGLSRSEDLPEHLLGFLHHDDVADIKARVESLPNGLATHAEFRVTVRGGSTRTVEASVIAVAIDERRAILWIGNDVTQRRELEAQLIQADRLAVLGTLAAGMAHAINNPLSYTLLNLEHVSRRLKHLDVEREYHSEARVRLAEAHDGAERVAKVVRQMRSLSRVKTSAPSPVDVRAVVDGVLAMVGNELRYRGQLTTQCDAAPRVWAREGELEQAFLGLLLYVARSLPDQPNSEREIRVTTGTDPDGNALFSVSDDGPPMSTDARARLFDPFASGDAQGLGLAMCQAVLTSLGGRLDVESQPRVGTTFRVMLPASADPAAESRRSLAPPLRLSDTPPPVRARVLVIDDDPGVTSTLYAMLEAHHDVTSVNDAREGLNLLLGPTEFDIVFCDLVMPELSGMELYCAVELNQPLRLERIVFMTGGVFTPEAHRFLARVPNARIEKPFSLARVEQLLAGVSAHTISSRPPDRG